MPVKIVYGKMASNACCKCLWELQSNDTLTTVALFFKVCVILYHEMTQSLLLLIYSSSGKMACIVRCKMPVKTIIRENGKQCMLQKPVKNYITTIPIYCGVSRLVIQVHVKSTHLMTWLNIMARYMTSLCSQIYGLIFQIVREIITVLQYSCLVIVNT